MVLARQPGANMATMYLYNIVASRVELSRQVMAPSEFGACSWLASRGVQAAVRCLVASIFGSE